MGGGSKPNGWRFLSRRNLVFSSLPRGGSVGFLFVFVCDADLNVGHADVPFLHPRGATTYLHPDGSDRIKLPPGGLRFHLVITVKPCWELFGALSGGFAVYSSLDALLPQFSAHNPAGHAIPQIRPRIGFWV